MGNGAVSPKSKYTVKDELVGLLEQTDLLSLCEKLEGHADLRTKFAQFYHQGAWIERLVELISSAFPESDTTVKLPMMNSTIGAEDTSIFSVGTVGIHLLILAIALRLFGRSQEMQCWLQMQDDLLVSRKTNLRIITRAAVSAKNLLKQVSPSVSPDGKSGRSMSMLWRNMRRDEDDEVRSDDDEDEIMATSWDSDEEQPVTPTHNYRSLCYCPASAPRELFLRQSACCIHPVHSHKKSDPALLQSAHSLREQAVRNLCLQSIETWSCSAKCGDRDSARTALTEEEDKLCALLSRGHAWIDELARFLNEDMNVPISISRALTLEESVQQKCPTRSPVIYINRAFEQLSQVSRTSLYGRDLIQALQHEAYSERQGLDELHEAFLLGQAAQSTVTFARQKHSTAFTDQVTVLPVVHSSSQQHHLTVATHCVLAPVIANVDEVCAESAELVAHFVRALLT